MPEIQITEQMILEAFQESAKMQVYKETLTSALEKACAKLYVANNAAWRLVKLSYPDLPVNEKILNYNPITQKIFWDDPK